MKRFGLLGSSALASAAIFGVFAVGVTPAGAQVVGPADVVIPSETNRPECAEGNPDRPADCDEQDQEAEIRNADGSDADPGEPIVVTGTRIRLPNLESIEPITTLDSRQLRERNFTNVADAINELPGFRGSVTPAGGQGFGQGVNFVNNYGLGSNRTLTLINGRRFVSSNVATIFANAGAGTQVDLNIVPSILVDRIDTVSVGGAPVYGSDAISGTVNLILRSKFDGLELNVTNGISEEGDAHNYNFSGIAGRSFFGDRLNVTIVGSHDNLDGLVFNDRDFLRRRIGGATNPSSAQAAALRPGGASTPANDGRLNSNIGFNNNTSDNNPGTVLIRAVNIPFLTRGGLITSSDLGGAGTNPNNPAVPFGVATPFGLQFDRSGNLVPFNQGIVFPGTSGSGGDGFVFSDFTQITSDLKRTTLNGFVTLEVVEDVELFAEGTYFRSRADELTQQPTFNSTLFGGLSGELQFTTASTPFLTDPARAALTSRGVTRFGISRNSADLADLTGFNKTRLYFGVGGLRAKLDLLGKTFDFEAYASHGKTRSSDFGQDINAQNFVNAVNVDAAGRCTTATTVVLPTSFDTANTVTSGPNFASPITRSRLTGAIVSGLVPIADASCVPANLLGEGRASQAVRDYIIEDFVTVSEQEQTVFNANVGGSLFDLWGAGAVGINVGYEHREEKASFTPSDFQQAGRGRSVAITPLSGKYNLDEVFGEIVIPLASPDNDFTFIHNAQLIARGRYVDNTVNGGFFSYALGASYAPVEDIEFRGNYTRSFRSPAITELFLPIVNTFAFVPDLCSRANRNAGSVPLVRARNCAAFIAAFPGTEATPDPASLASVPAQSGGNPNLDNEEADSYTIGAIIRPRFLPRFALTVDYISITLNQPISNLSVAAIVGGCFDNPDFNTADILNANSFCSRINRNPTTGRVFGDPQNPAVRSGFVNGVEIKFRGIQGTMGYSVPLSALGLGGTLSLGGDMLYVRRRLNNITGVAPARSDGILGDPEFSGQLRVRYVEKNFGINTTINYVGEQLFSRFNRAPGVAGSGPDARELDELNDYVTVNGAIFFDPTDDFRFTLSVNNLFNRQGQEYFGELHPSSFNDLIGRSFRASARVRF